MILVLRRLGLNSHEAGIKLMTLGYNYKASGLSTTPWGLAVVRRMDSVHALDIVIFTREISYFSKPHYGKCSKISNTKI